MNILVIGKFTEGQFGFHIADVMKDMGHIVFEYDPSYPIKYYNSLTLRRFYQIKSFAYTNLLMTSSFRNFRRKKLYSEIRKNNIDLILCTHDFLHPEEIDKIRTISKCKIAMWFPDPIAYFNRAFFMIADYDAIFFKDPYIVNILREQYNKNNVYYLPECCNPKYHKSIELNEYDRKRYGCDVTTYGSPHNIRSAFYVQLLNYNYKIKIWGHSPPTWLNDKKIKTLYMGEYVYNESKAKSVLAAKININTLVPFEIYGLNARAFEIAGIGGFQIIHWRMGLSDFFEDGKELVSFNTFNELIEKINYYSSNDAKRTVIAEAGRMRAYKEHTYNHRLQLLFETIFKKGEGFNLPEINFKYKVQ